MVELIQIQTKIDLLIALRRMEVEFVPNHPLFAQWFKKNLAEYISGNRVLFAIDYSSSIVGYVLLHFFGDVVKFNAIVVFPENRRLGIAKNVFTLMIYELKKRKVKLLFSQVRQEYFEIRNLNAMFGFTQIGAIYNSEEQKDNDLFYLLLDDFVTMDFIKQSALRIYTKNKIIWK